MKTVTLLQEVIHRSVPLPQGSQQSLDDATAQQWVDAGIAKFCEPEAKQPIKAAKGGSKEES